MTRPGADPQLTFSYVHQDELSEVRKRRDKQCYERADIDNPQPNLVGLALSGGGIRSATFCLGFLQELQRLRLLRIFDYLSTVSGGGYLGGWWSAWLSRRQEDVSQSPSFAPEDISNSVSLLRRIVESPEAVAEDFRTHLEESERGKILLGLVERPDLEHIATRLYEPLADELTGYVDKGDTLELKWQRRASLIDTFPCELRGLFPPNERIEPDREKSRDVYEKESDGSRCAWEDPIHHLRLFANYLTPRKGILSADTWRAISVVTRNLILTWLILLPLLVGVMLISQAYLLLHPASYEAFVCTPPNCPEGSLTIALKVILLPITVLLVATLVMAVAWLLCNRDSSSSLDWMVQWVGLFTLTVMFVAAVVAIPTLRDPIVNYFYLPKTFGYLLGGDWYHPVPADVAPHLLRLRLFTSGVAVLFFIVLLMWNLGINSHAFQRTGLDTTNFSSWKREVRRGRFGRAQARLLVMTSIVGAVLFLSWISCVLIRNDSFEFGLKVPTITLLPLLSAIGGSIFTALRASPIAEGDRATSRQPSMVSRFVFAATPPLVVGVLAVLAAWFVHWLLLIFLRQQGTKFGDSLFALLDGAPVLLTMLCIGLAIYELGDVQWSKVFKLSLGSILFMCLVMINLSWFAQALLRYGYRNPNGPWLYLLVTSAFIAVLVTALVFRRMIPKGKWKWRLFRNLDFVRRKIRTKGTNTSPITAWRLLSFGSLLAGALLFGALTTVGFLIGLLVYLNTAQTVAGKISGALVLTFLALGGGVILFRLVVDRVKTHSGENLLSLRLLSHRSLGKRPEALWLAASICLTLPIIMICVGHYLRWRNEPTPHVKWSETLTLFPLSVIALLFSLMVLRSLVIQKLLCEGKPIVGWSGGIFEWLFDRIPKVNQNRRRAYQVSALVAICMVSLLDTVLRGISPSQPTAAMSSAFMNWKWMTAAFVVSLPVFGVSVFQIPFNATSYEAFKGRRRRWLHSKAFLWSLATACVGWALLVGLLLPKWLSHVADIPLNTGLTPFLLPVAAGFLLIVLFELYWGERDNRRSLILVSIGYLVVASIFFMNLAGLGLSWHLVFGLLAAICVWVAALG